jgi:uncharacterized protein (DUF488 family)
VQPGAEAIAEIMDNVTKPSSRTIWTLGHGQRSFDEYVEMLTDYDIKAVVDIRSKPLARFYPHFNRNRLQPALEEVGFAYTYLGDRLGGMPSGDEHYDKESHTLYAPISREPWFIAGIEQVEQLAETHNVALLCLEEQPERCHRHLLLGKTLTDRRAQVEHIRHAGYTESQTELDERLDITAASYTEDAWRSPMPMKGGHNKR